MSMKELIAKMECSLKTLQGLLNEVSYEIAGLQEETELDETSKEKLLVLMESKNDLLENICETKNLLRLHTATDDIEAGLLAISWEKDLVEEKYAEIKEELNACCEKISQLSKDNVILEDQLHNTEFNLQMDVFEASLNELVNDQQSVSLTICSPTSLCSPNGAGMQKILQAIRYQADSGNLDEAIHLCNGSIPRFEDAFGKDHVNIGVICLELYKMYMQRGMVDLAMQSLRNAQRIYEKVYKKDEHSGVLDFLFKVFRGKGDDQNERREVEAMHLTPVMKVDNKEIQHYI